MHEWFGRSFAGLAVAVSMAVFTGCSSGGSDEPSFPDNTLQINDEQVPLDPPADVTYYADQRWVILTDASGAYVELGFERQGDPTYYELPIGHWTEASPDFVSVRVCVGSSCRAYYPPDEVRGEVYVQGSEGAGGVLAIAGALTLENRATVDGIVFSYSGGYTWGLDQALRATP